MIDLTLLLAHSAMAGALLTAQGPQRNGADQLVERGRQALSSHQYDEAQQALELAVREQPEDSQAWCLLGRSILGRADLMPAETEEQWNEVAPLYELAEEHLRRAIDLNEADDELWADLGRVLLREGNATEAIATFYHAQSLGNVSLQLLVDLADAQLLAYRYAQDVFNSEEADNLLEQAHETLVKANQGLLVQAEVLRRLGSVSILQGNPDEALRHLRRAIAIVPSDDSLHTSLLKAVEKEHAFDDAINFYTGLVEEPARALWYASRAHQLKGHYKYNRDLDYAAASREYEIAEEKLFRSSRLEPDFDAGVRQWVPQVRSWRGYALMRGGKLDEAEAAFLSALDRTPDLENALQGLTDLMDERYGRSGAEKSSKEDYDVLRAYAARVCVVDPHNGNAWNNYGFFAREAGKYEESFQAYRRSIEIEPDNARFLNDTALILIYHLGRDLDLAEEWLLDARDLSEEQYYSGDTDEPMDWVKETYGDSMINLIMLYHKMGQLHRARDMYTRVNEELPERVELSLWRKRLNIPEPPVPELVPPDPAATDSVEDGGEVPPPKLGNG